MEYAGTPRFKKSQGKATVPGRKQVFRRIEGGLFRGDVIGLDHEELAGERLLKEYVRDGKIIAQPLSLKDIAKRAAEQMRSLPEDLKSLDAAFAYPVSLSDAVVELQRRAELLLDHKSAR